MDHAWKARKAIATALAKLAAERTAPSEKEAIVTALAEWAAPSEKESAARLHAGFHRWLDALARKTFGELDHRPSNEELMANASEIVSWYGAAATEAGQHRRKAQARELLRSATRRPTAKAGPALRTYHSFTLFLLGCEFEMLEQSGRGTEAARELRDLVRFITQKGSGRRSNRPPSVLREIEKQASDGAPYAEIAKRVGETRQFARSTAKRLRRRK